jgi:hypothetical protein
MSTIVHHECRHLDHLRAGSRRGKGGPVIHHGSVRYCDGLHVDGAHRWVATGGVPIEILPLRWCAGDRSGHLPHGSVAYVPHPRGLASPRIANLDIKDPGG